MRKKALSVLFAALFCLLPLVSASAATLTERLEAIETELSITANGSLIERIAAAESAVGITPPEGATSADRIAALEKDLAIVSGGPIDVPTPLTSLKPFTISYVSTNFNEKNYEDSFNGVHLTMITPTASLGFGDHEIEYLLNGEYKKLRGNLYIPKSALGTLTNIDILRVKFFIYGDDQLLYTMPALTLKDEPVSFSLNVSNVKFLKIAFDEACTIAGPYIVLGDAELVK